MPDQSETRNQKSAIPARLAGLTGLTLTAHRLVEGLLVGEHRSRHLGPGAEFHDYRPYSFGDDAAGIDWKRYARTDRLYVRRHRRDTELSLLVVLDTSPSMDWPRTTTPEGSVVSHHTSKLQFARQLAAALVLLAARQGDRAGLAVAGPGPVELLRPAPGWPHAHRLCRAIERARAQPGQASLAHTLGQLTPELPRGTMLAIVSDLLDQPTDWLNAFPPPAGATPATGRGGGAGGAGGAIVLQVLSPAELDITRLGPGPRRLRDPETDRSHLADTTDVARAYARRMHQHLTAIADVCRRQHARYALARTDRSPIHALRQVLAPRPYA